MLVPILYPYQIDILSSIIYLEIIIPPKYSLQYCRYFKLLPLIDINYDSYNIETINIILYYLKHPNLEMICELFLDYGCFFRRLDIIKLAISAGIKIRHWCIFKLLEGTVLYNNDLVKTNNQVMEILEILQISNLNMMIFTAEQAVKFNNIFILKFVIKKINNEDVCVKNKMLEAAFEQAIKMDNLQSVAYLYKMVNPDKYLDKIIKYNAKLCANFLLLKSNRDFFEEYFYKKLL